MTFSELQSIKVPFDIYNRKHKYIGTVSGYTKNDPLGVGGGLLPDMPCVFTKNGGWLLMADFLNNYVLVKGKVIESHKYRKLRKNEAKITCLCGAECKVLMVGNNNADGKSLCICGRNITIHLRKNIPLGDYNIDPFGTGQRD